MARVNAAWPGGWLYGCVYFHNQQAHNSPHGVLTCCSTSTQAATFSRQPTHQAQGNQPANTQFRDLLVARQGQGRGGAHPHHGAVPHQLQDNRLRRGVRLQCVYAPSTPFSVDQFGKQYMYYIRVERSQKVPCLSQYNPYSTIFGSDFTPNCSGSGWPQSIFRSICI